MKIRFNLSPFRLILLGYLAIILVGGLLLALPVCSRSGEWTPALDSFFTATSAVCVTGLVRTDTYLHWSVVGQLIILLLIQVGGVGFMTVAMSVFTITGKRIGIFSRLIMKESVSAPQFGGMVRITRVIVLGTAMFETAGAVLLCLHFCPKLGFFKGVWFSVFHSVSAFCNAGFDLMGGEGEFSSLTTLADNVYVNVIIMLLIIVGGLGFFVWSDIIEHKFRFSSYRVHSKLVLIISASLIVIGAGLILLFDVFASGKKFSGGEVLQALFGSVSARTAGFSTVDLTMLCEPAKLTLVCLMLIGGSPGSTAGGMKTTTFGAVLLTVWATVRRKKSVEFMGRRISDGVVRTAVCVFAVYLTVVIAATLTVSAIENVPVMTAMFETASAAATVGSSLGLTQSLSAVSSAIIIALMIFGRVGGVTLLLAVTSDRREPTKKLPVENIQVG